MITFTVVACKHCFSLYVYVNVMVLFCIRKPNDCGLHD